MVFQDLRETQATMDRTDKTDGMAQTGNQVSRDPPVDQARTGLPDLSDLQDYQDLQALRDLQEILELLVRAVKRGQGAIRAYAELMAHADLQEPRD